MVVRVKFIKAEKMWEAQHTPTKLAYSHTDRDIALFELGRLVAAQMQLFDTEEGRPGCL